MSLVKKDQFQSWVHITRASEKVYRPPPPPPDQDPFTQSVSYLSPTLYPTRSWDGLSDVRVDKNVLYHQLPGDQLEDGVREALEKICYTHTDHSRSSNGYTT